MRVEWIALGIIAVGVTWMLISFRYRASRRWMRRVDSTTKGTWAEDVVLRTRDGREFGVHDLHGRVALVVTVPTRDVDRAELAALAEFTRHYPAGAVRVLAQPVGEGDLDARLPEGIDTLAPATRHPLADRVEREFGRIDVPSTKLLIDGEGCVRARLSPATRPPDAELYRAVDQALKDVAKETEAAH